MKTAFPMTTQPILQLDPEDETTGRYARHPHGWSRNIEMLHDVTDYMTPEILDASPLYLEIGCGHGEFIERLAKADPAGHYIGVENVPYFAVSAAKRVLNAGLDNVLILNQNANALLSQVFPNQSLDKMYILYPDPWPKRRHRKRRLIREETYQRFQEVLTSGGEIEIWTDTEEWVELSAPFLRRLPGTLQEEEITDRLHTPRTLFERKAKSKQHPIFHLLYQK